MDQELPEWRGCAPPALDEAIGAYARLSLFDAVRDAEALFCAIAGPRNDALYRYLPHGNFASPSALADFIACRKAQEHWRTFTIGPREGGVLGMASYMRVRAEHGSAEVGCVLFSPSLQKSRLATEAMYIMARHVFDDLGYRRYEWKCNAANAASKRAAERLGFAFEGRFRKDMVAQGRSRDTDWYSLLDDEWPCARAALEAWLSPSNFDAEGGQIQRLGDMRSTAVAGGRGAR